MALSAKRKLPAITIIFVLVSFLTTPATLADADWRKDLGVFRIGLVSSGDIVGTQARSEPFRLAISEALGMEVELFLARDAANLVTALAGSRIEYAVFSSMAYALTWSLCECVEPLVVPQAIDGTTGYQTVLISAPDGPADLEELQHQTVGALAEDSFTGFPLAAYLLRQQGVDLISGDIGITFEPSAELAVEAFVAGRYPVQIGWRSSGGDPSAASPQGTLARIAELDAVNAVDYKVIWESPPVPHRPHAIRKRLDAELKRLLRDVLTAMFNNDPVAYDSIEPNYGGGFVAARHASFATLVDFVRSGVAAELAKRKTPQQ